MQTSSLWVDVFLDEGIPWSMRSDKIWTMIVKFDFGITRTASDLISQFVKLITYCGV